MVKKVFFFILAALVLSSMLSACGSQGSLAVSTTQNVEMGEFMFTPSEMAVPVGKEVTLNLKNNGSIEHDFVVLKKGVVAVLPFDADAQKGDILFEARLGSGKSQIYTFTLPEVGNYEIVCSVPGHLEAGMKARLRAR
jgi:uncharacterized cupredoxin-like copper-binding protein